MYFFRQLYFTSGLLMAVTRLQKFSLYSSVLQKFCSINKFKGSKKYYYGDRFNMSTGKERCNALLHQQILSLCPACPLGIGSEAGRVSVANVHVIIVSFMIWMVTNIWSVCTVQYSLCYYITVNLVKWMVLSSCKQMKIKIEHCTQLSFRCKKELFYDSLPLLYPF